MSVISNEHQNGAVFGEQLDETRDGVLKPMTTLPPGPESVTVAEFERKIEEKGESDARLENIARNTELLRDGLTIGRVLASVGPNARKILLDVAARLEKGAAQYGDFDGVNADRDWDQETYEEHLDAVVYQAAKRVLKR